MFNIKKSEINLINSVVQTLDPSENMDKMGAWGILHLVCGAIAGQSLSWKSAVIEGLPSQYEVINNYLLKATSDEEIAVIFSNYIVQWSKDNTVKLLAKRRLDQLLKTKNQTMSKEQYEYFLNYLTLAIMLNSLSELDCYEDFNKVKEWASNHKNGWQILFYAAGLLLSNDDNFRWKIYGSCIKDMSNSKKQEVERLFSYFRNNR